MKLLKQAVIKSVLIAFVIGCVSGCGTPTVLMDRDGLYKFPAESPPLHLLYLDKNNKWMRTPTKVRPSSGMVIIFEE